MSASRSLVERVHEMDYGFSLSECMEAATRYPHLDHLDLANRMLAVKMTLTDMGIDPPTSQAAAERYPNDADKAVTCALQYNNDKCSTSLGPLTYKKLEKNEIRALLRTLLQMKQKCPSVEEKQPFDAKNMKKFNDALEKFYRHVLFVEKPFSASSTSLRKKKVYTECHVCFSASPVQMINCGHAISCSECIEKHLASRLEEKMIPPWISCLEDSCKISIDIRQLSSFCHPSLLLETTVVYMDRMLRRESDWVPGTHESCRMGFWFDPKEIGQTCPSCSLTQQVQLKSSTVDSGLSEMVQKGVLKPCPKCSELAMKDYGMCNVMQCHKCGIYWNWRNFETGNSYDEVKNKARRNGTMWEPGELDYQRRLERSDPEEFKKLLERNGIAYNPKYVRGSG